jgi:quinol monooxygenase YgiN
LRYLIYERYRSKDDYLGAHKQSQAFVDFRPKMKAMQVSESERERLLGRTLA